MVLRLLKKPDVLARHLFRNTTLYQHIRDGVFTPPVKIGSHSSAWPEHESDAILRARIAGRTDDEIRKLVSDLVAERSTLDARVAA